MTEHRIRIHDDGSIMVDPFDFARGVELVKKEGIRELNLRADELDREPSELDTNADLSLLAQIRNLERFSISLSLPKKRLTNFSSVNALSRLESLGIHDYPALDLDWFPLLLTLSVTERSTLQNLSHSTKLTNLRIWRLRDGDLERFGRMTTLKRLWLAQSTTTELRNVRAVETLADLEIHNSRQLNQISGLPDSMRKLTIDACPNIRDLDFSTIGSNLESLYVDYPASLDFIARMRNLREFAFQSVRFDDLTPLLASESLRRVFFTERRRYSHTPEQINTILSFR